MEGMLTAYITGVIITLVLMGGLVYLKNVKDKRAQRARKYTIDQEVGYTATIAVLWPVFIIYVVLHFAGIVK